MDHSKAGAPGVLKVILEPPSAAKPGQTLYPPLVLSLRTENEHDQQMHSHPNSISDDEQQDGAAISPVPSDLASETANEGSDTVWAFVHLVPDSRDAVQVPISPPHHTATGLKGTLTASPHHAVSPVSEKGVQYIKFEDLSINNIGLFSLRVVLCRMQRVSGHSSLSVGAATTIGCINTRRIFVHPSGYHPVGSEESKSLADLVAQGVMSSDAYPRDEFPGTSIHLRKVDSDGHLGKVLSRVVPGVVGRRSSY